MLNFLIQFLKALFLLFLNYVFMFCGTYAVFDEEDTRSPGGALQASEPPEVDAGNQTQIFYKHRVLS